MIAPVLLVVACWGVATAGHQDDSCLQRMEACSSTQRRPVCGSDNLTYISKCHLLRAQCHGVHVTMKHHGKCRDSQQCWTDLHYAQRIPRPAHVQLFAPTCLEDGTYAPVQCHQETGYCWCVSPGGRPVPGTSVRHGHPVCGRKGKSGTRRRSSPAGRKYRRGCSRMERSAFINNLMNNFKAEYRRLPALAGVRSRPAAEEGGEEGEGSVERAVLAWKFSEMDRDNDTFLSKGEYGELRRLVRKVVRPKKCAKLFPRVCDRDTDRRVSREEWTACLGINFNHERRAEGAAKAGQEEVLQGSLTSQADYGDDSPKRTEDMEANDCLSDQKTALEEQKSGTSGLYVPQCTPDGRYRKVQCYNSTGYCWCVYEDTGVPIPGTSIKDQNPNCDVPPPARPMNGCPEERKQMFLREFLDYMKKKMVPSKSRNSPDSEVPAGSWQDESVATWAFNMLDKNRNKVWERKEWRTLRTLVMAQPQLRKCGKRLPRYCDVNQDDRISLTEWLTCLSAHSSPAGMATTTVAAADGGTSASPAASQSASSSSNRTGSNPLSLYLKPE